MSCKAWRGASAGLPQPHVPLGGARGPGGPRVVARAAFGLPWGLLRAHPSPEATALGVSECLSGAGSIQYKNRED